MSFMKNNTALCSNNLKLQFAIMTLGQFDDYYRNYFLKASVMFTLYSVLGNIVICRLVNLNFPPDKSFSFNSKITN